MRFCYSDTAVAVLHLDSQREGNSRWPGLFIISHNTSCYDYQIVSTVPWSWQGCDYFNARKITLKKNRMAASHLVFAFASSLLVIANGQQKVRNWGSFQIFTLEPGAAGQPSFHRRRRETDPGSQMCRWIPQHWGGGEVLFFFIFFLAIEEDRGVTQISAQDRIGRKSSG